MADALSVMRKKARKDDKKVSELNEIKEVFASDDINIFHMAFHFQSSHRHRSDRRT